MGSSYTRVSANGNCRLQTLIFLKGSNLSIVSITIAGLAESKEFEQVLSKAFHDNNLTATSDKTSIIQHRITDKSSSQLVTKWYQGLTQEFRIALSIPWVLQRLHYRNYQIHFTFEQAYLKLSSVECRTNNVLNNKPLQCAVVENLATHFKSRSPMSAWLRAHD